MKKIIALVLSTVMALSICCMPVFAEDVGPREVLETAIDAVLNRDAETYFNLSYTEGVDSVEDLEAEWATIDKEVEYRILDEVHKDDSLAVYNCFMKSESGAMAELTIFVKKIDGIWTVYNARDVRRSPYYDCATIVIENGEYTRIEPQSSSVEVSNQSPVTTRGLDQIGNWGFYDLASNFTHKTKFYYTGSGALTLNLKQWTNNGMPAIMWYDIIYRWSSGSQTYGSQKVTGNYPDGGSQAVQLHYTVPYVWRDLYLDIWNVGNMASGYGEVYNY